MADISKLNPNGTVYNIKDEVARTTKAEAIEKTMAQYEELSTAEKLDPTKIYFIPDYSGGGGTELMLYDMGTEGVAWTVSNGSKNADNISLNVGAGSYTSYAVTANPIDVTNYNTLHVVCRYRSQDYDLDLDISSYTGSWYISFTYLTDLSHNEAAIGFTSTNIGGVSIRIDSRNGSAAEQILYQMSLS
jgi:hypothetical protein